jgi:hypothetical protein
MPAPAASGAAVAAQVAAPDSQPAWAIVYHCWTTAPLPSRTQSRYHVAFGTGFQL